MCFQGGLIVMDQVKIDEVAEEATESTDPKVIRAAMGKALKNIPISKNPYEVTDVTGKGSFVTEATLSVVKDGKIVQLDIE